MDKYWNRYLWGIRMDDGKWSKLLGEAWHQPRPESYHGEPSRVLLFTSRNAARVWCRSKLHAWSQNPATAGWKIRVVRVRETLVQTTTT